MTLPVLINVIACDLSYHPSTPSRHKASGTALRVTGCFSPDMAAYSSESPLQSDVLGILDDLLIFRLSWPPDKLRIVHRTECRPVLVHDINVGINRNLVRNEIQYLLRPRKIVRQHQMPNENSLNGDAGPIDLKAADLPMHFFDCRPHDIPIIFGARVFPCVLVVRILNVRHIDVNNAVEQLECCDRLISPAIVDDRKRQTLLDRCDKCLNNLGSDVCWSDEIDIVAPHTLQREHDFRELLGSCFPAIPEMTDFVVLTEETLEIARCKEDGS